MGTIAGRRWACTFAAAALSFGLDCGSPARGQYHRSEPPPAAPPTTLTGDWGGLRSYLDRNGVTVTLNYTNDFLANVRGGIGPGAVAIGIFQPQLDLDLQKLVGWQGGKFHTHGLITHGPFFSATYLGNKVTFLLDAMVGVISVEQNNIIKLFSVAAVVLMPPTLIASIYGMNFKNMPELGWDFGYPMAIVLMVIAAILPYWFFKWKRWL